MTGAKPAHETRSHAATLPLNPFQGLWLDMLRGLAAQLVVLAHAIELVFPQRHLGSAEIGQFGLSVFFLLSGFLITQTILDRAAASRFTLREFMASRFARIYAPLLIAALDAVMLDWPHYAWRQDYGLAQFLALPHPFHGPGAAAAGAGGLVSGWMPALVPMLAANAAALPFAAVFEIRYRMLRAWLLVRVGDGGARRGTG